MFNLQRFGNNDVMTTSRNLKIKMVFGNDDRLLSLKNPRGNVTEEQIKNVFSDVTVTQVVIGDKDGAPYTGLGTAYIEEKTVVDLDLS